MLSLYKTSKGLRSTFLNNAAHFPQVSLAAVVILVESPLVMSSAAARNLLWKQVRLAGSTVARAFYVGSFCPFE